MTIMSLFICIIIITSVLIPVAISYAHFKCQNVPEYAYAQMYFEGNDPKTYCKDKVESNKSFG